MLDIEIKKLNTLAKIPTRGSDFSAGYDLYTIEKYTLKPLERKLFKTGISMAIPNDTYGRIAPRSGYAFKFGLDVLAGVIDSDYRDDIGVILINLGENSIELPIVKNDIELPIAQIIFESCNSANFTESENLPDSIRNLGGFGSTDNKITIHKTPQPNKTSPVIETKSSIVNLYSKAGGIPIKQKYSEEIKKRNE